MTTWRFHLGVFLAACLGLAGGAPGAPINYSKEIRPILSENCFYCHGQDANKRKAKLRLDTQEGQRAKGIVVPGKPDESDVIARIFSKDEEEQMPPPKSNRHLTDDQRQLLKRWVAEGATFEGHWAFTAPKRPDVPKVDGQKIANPIDAFIQSKLAEKGLKPSPEADRRTLIRRVTFDLTGLPPTPAEVDAFVDDKSPDAYEKVVDRLMASQHYGERMALPWLDAARYADSNGFQQDGDTYQWVWRDWVVKAFNDNKPFDQFTIEQLAGDLLPNATIDQKIATGFNRNHLLNGEGGAIAEEQRFVILFDRVDVTATNWLGLTMACAQCHDHKYDPLTMKDYYSLQSAFNNLPETGGVRRLSAKIRLADPVLDVASPEQKAKLAELQQKVKDLQAQVDKQRKAWEQKAAEDDKFPDKEILKLLKEKDSKGAAKADREKKLKKYFDDNVLPKLKGDLPNQIKKAEAEAGEFGTDDYPRVMVMSDDKPRETFILDRGDYLSKKEKVTFDTPASLPPLPKDAPRNRLGLAQWLVSPEQPLTARVTVNRMWQNFFGIGLVKTAEDFGVQSEPPVHQDLIDWLAVDFRETGWDMKRLNRLIVTSQAYRQSSKVTPALLAADPENRYLTRGARFRLPAMILRDTALATSGLLNDKLGGKPVYPYQPEGIWESLAITKERDFTYPKSSGQDLYRRSLYTFWRRTVSPANMFDNANRQACRVRASITNTPLHALTTMNDPTWVEAARVLAQNTIKSEKEIDARFDAIYRKVLARVPTDKERATLRRMLGKQQEHFKAAPEEAKKLATAGIAPKEQSLDAVEHAAWTQVCLAVFNLDEALTRE